MNLAEAALIARTTQRYSEPHRAYHGIGHLVQAMGFAEELLSWRGLPRFPESREEVVDEELLSWAVLFHDAVYRIGRPDNEERSAELAQRELAKIGFGRAEEVAEAIRLTAEHDRAHTLTQKLLLDADLAILGQDRGLYRSYVRDVRREYLPSHDAESSRIWQTGRSAVLRTFLERERIYATDVAAVLWEEQARSNLEWESAALEAGEEL